MLTKETLIILLSSGLAGAIGGGIVSFINQYFQHKLERRNSIHIIKMELYAEISKIGNSYTSEDAFKSLNSNIAKALLVCDNKLRLSMINYMAYIENLHNKLEDATDGDKAETIIDDSADEHYDLEREVHRHMREELEL